MKNKQIYLVRHGEIVSNYKKIYAGWSSESLTQKGIEQANSVGGKLSTIEIDHIYSSPINRAYETALIIKDYFNVPLTIKEGLKEMKMGPWEGLSEAQVEKNFPNEWAVWNTNSPAVNIAGRETLQELQTRAVNAVTEILKDDSVQTSIAVSHVAIIRCLCLFYKKLPLSDYKKIHVPNVAVFCLSIEDGSEFIIKEI